MSYGFCIPIARGECTAGELRARWRWEGTGRSDSDRDGSSESRTEVEREMGAVQREAVIPAASGTGLRVRTILLSGRLQETLTKPSSASIRTTRESAVLTRSTGSRSTSLATSEMIERHSAK